MSRQRLFSLVCAVSLGVLARGFLREVIRPQRVSATTVNLAVLNIQVLNAKTGGPISDLAVGDFQIVDNGESVRPVIFRNEPPESIAFWFVVGCLVQNKMDREAAANLDPALKELNATDTVGVARWCGNKSEPEIVLAPTQDRQRASAALDGVRASDGGLHVNGGDLNFVRKTIQLLHSNSPSPPEPSLEAAVFLGTDEVLAAKDEAQALSKEILTHTAMSLNYVSECPPTSPMKERVPLMRFLSDTTGGRVFSSGTAAGEAVKKIVAGLRARYLLAWLPSSNPGWHEIKVQLTQESVQKRETVVLKYRSGYLGRPRPPRYLAIEAAPYGRRLPNSDPDSNRDSYRRATIPVEADGAAFEGESHNARFILKVGGDHLSWNATSEGNDRCEISVNVTFLSSKEEVISQEEHRYSAVRNKNDGWVRLSGTVELSMVSGFPPDADRVRFVVKDEATGRIGVVDMTMRQVLDAPRLRAVIA